LNLKSINTSEDQGKCAGLNQGEKESGTVSIRRPLIDNFGLLSFPRERMGGFFHRCGSQAKSRDKAAIFVRRLRGA